MTTVIRSFGKAVPQKRVFNSDLPVELNTSDEWIRSHTGIESRYIADDKETCLSLGVSASKIAIEKANISPDEIDVVIFCTTTPEYSGFPSTACLLQPQIGAKNATCFDISAACSGFLYGLNIAKGLLETNSWHYALICGSEKLSEICDWTDRSSCILFGDGAGAAVIERIEGTADGADKSVYGKIGNFVSGSDGSGSNALYREHNSLLKMDGSAVYNFAVGAMTNAIKLVMENENITESQVDYFVCHQANERILNAAAKRLGFNFEKFICTMGEYGNTSSASIPITMFDMIEQGKIKKGTTIVSAAFGAGLTWAGTIFRF